MVSSATLGRTLPKVYIAGGGLAVLQDNRVVYSGAQYGLHLVRNVFGGNYAQGYFCVIFSLSHTKAL